MKSLITFCMVLGIMEIIWMLFFGAQSTAGRRVQISASDKSDTLLIDLWYLLCFLGRQVCKILSLV